MAREKIADLQEERAEILKAAHDIQDKAEREKRGLTSEEEANVKKALDAAQILDKKIDAKVRLLEAERIAAAEEIRRGTVEWGNDDPTADEYVFIRQPATSYVRETRGAAVLGNNAGVAAQSFRWAPIGAEIGLFFLITAIGLILPKWPTAISTITIISSLIGALAGAKFLLLSDRRPS